MKTTAQHFKIFKKECEKWIPLLGIMDWRIVIEHKDLDDSKSNLAWTLIDSSQKSCTIALSMEWCDNKILPETLKRCALHEVCHVRFSILDDMLTDRGYCQDEVDKLVHGFIYMLENILFGIGE